jgi:hypothetical protein
MLSDVITASTGASFGAIFPLGIGLILVVITPLIAAATHRRRRNEWRHMNWITALYIFGFEGMATTLIYGGVKGLVDVENVDVGGLSFFVLVVALLSVMAAAVWSMLVLSNINSRGGGTLGRR